MTNQPRLLTIAGSDSGGGAGIQADLKTFQALGTYGMSCITALTAQNTREVRRIAGVDVAMVKDQLDAVFEDIGVDAVKIGMLHDSELIDCVAAALTRHQPPIIVIDPVMVSKSGAQLLQQEAIQTLQTTLLPLATLLTPNIPEAKLLCGLPTQNRQVIRTREDMENVSWSLHRFCRWVLLKGGHLDAGSLCEDLLYGETIHWFAHSRIHTTNTHGTGCTLSAAIAALLGHGLAMEAAVSQAISYLQAAIKSGAAQRLGSGHGPVDHQVYQDRRVGIAAPECL